MRSLLQTRYALLWCTALAAGLLGTGATDFGPDQPYDQLSTELVTPHVAFARPYAGGPVRALVIAPTWTQRETVELAQRLDLDFVPLMTESYECFGRYPGGGERESYMMITPEQFAAVVEERLAPTTSYQLVLIGKIPWRVFPESVRTRVLDRVRQGAGLLYVCPGELDSTWAAGLQDDVEARQAILGAVPWRVLPLLQTLGAGSLVRTGRLGQGRVVVLDYAQKREGSLSGWLECLTPFGCDDPLYYDYYLALVARAALWAAGRMPAPALAELPAETVLFQQTQLPGVSIACRVVGGPEPTTVEAVVRDRAGRVEWQQTGPPESATQVRLALPYLSTGAKMLDLRLLNAEQQVIEWASMPLMVAGPCTIRELRLASEVLARDTPVTGTVVVAGAETVPARTLVRIEVQDRHGRVVGATEQKLRAAETSFAFDLAGVVASSHRLEARLVQEKRVLAAATVPFWVNRTDFDDLCRDFSFVMWGGARDRSRAVSTYLDQLRAAGVNILYVTSALWDSPAMSGEIARRVATAGLLSAPYATRLYLAAPGGPAHLKPVDGKVGPEIPNCPLSLTAAEAAADSTQKHLAELGQVYGPFGPAYYSLGDENALAFPHIDVCFCTRCRDAFRGYVRGLYPSIVAVNQEWGSSYQDWAEVSPITLKQAQALGRCPQWLDHRVFMDQAFTNLHTTSVRTFTEADPQAKVGLEGPIYPTRSGTGFNFYRMLPEMRFFGPYPGAAEIHASLSFMPAPALRTVWFGSYQGDTFPAKMRGMPWKMLAEGMNAVAWWPAGVEGAAGLGGPAALRPDYLPLGHFALASAQIREIQSGIGRLLLSGTRLVQPIAVYYSNACLHAATIRPKETLWESSLQDFSDVLHDAGYEYRYLSPDDLLDGRWRDLKALILPYSQALSPREGKVLREFVAAGGLLLADFAPGIMDGHGRLLAESSLKDLFGEFTRLHVQRQGAGNAVYLADYVKGYQDKRRAGEAAGVAAGVARLLQELAGVAPAALIQDAEGRPRQDVTCAQFQHGSASYLLVVRDFLSTESDSPAVRLALPHRAQVYEVREARDLGETDRVDMSLAPGGAQVLALLPAKAAAIEATVSPRRGKPGDRVRLRVRVRPEALAGAGLGVRVEVLNPAGSPIPWYARTVVLTDGTGTATLTLARNELPGSYTFVARELASGNTARATLAVR